MITASASDTSSPQASAAGLLIAFPQRRSRMFCPESLTKGLLSRELWAPSMTALSPSIKSCADLPGNAQWPDIDNGQPGYLSG
jgi:hypothetical protein